MRLELNLRSGMRRPTAATLTAFLLLVMVPEALSIRYLVGGSDYGWSPKVNYTAWTKDKHFYNGDWLYFVYDRNKQGVIELNKKDYGTCNSDQPLHNWTGGFGRDVVLLNKTRTYYFIGGKDYCQNGRLKLEIKVEDPSLPPASSPEKSGSHVENPHTPPSYSPEKSHSHVENPETPPASSPEKSDPNGRNPTLPPASWQMITDSYVGNATPPPASSPKESDSSILLSTFKGQIFVPILFAVAATWDAFVFSFFHCHS